MFAPRWSYRPPGLGTGALHWLRILALVAGALVLVPVMFGFWLLVALAMGMASLLRLLANATLRPLTGHLGAGT